MCGTSDIPLIIALHIWAHQISLYAATSLIEVPVSSQESERSCVLSMSILHLFVIFLLVFGTVPTTLYYYFFHFILRTELI